VCNAQAEQLQHVHMKTEEDMQQLVQQFVMMLEQTQQKSKQLRVERVVTLSNYVSIMTFRNGASFCSS
jgi:hypothetical protein